LLKAFVGFSSPVGYDYVNQALICDSDQSDSPNPVIVGSTGILLLFDEIWFPCRSICPQSMRNLDYVRFVSDERPDIKLDFEVSRAASENLSSQVSINDLHREGYGGFIQSYYGADGGVDNHTHSISFLGENVTGSPTVRNFALDLHLLDQMDGDFVHILNGLTGRMAFPDGFGFLYNPHENRAIQIADRTITIASIYDVTGPSGPYHPVLEELRNHSYLRSFRAWARGEASALHNRPVQEILADLNAVTRDFEEASLRSAIAKDGLKETGVALLKGLALDLAPGAHTIATAIDTVSHYRSLEQQKISAFVANSRGALWKAKAEAYQSDVDSWFNIPQSLASRH
jgi:hypothetical protein